MKTSDRNGVFSGIIYLLKETSAVCTEPERFVLPSVGWKRQRSSGDVEAFGTLRAHLLHCCEGRCYCAALVRGHVYASPVAAQGESCCPGPRAAVPAPDAGFTPGFSIKGVQDPSSLPARHKATGQRGVGQGTPRAQAERRSHAVRATAPRLRAPPPEQPAQAADTCHTIVPSLCTPGCSSYPR